MLSLSRIVESFAQGVKNVDSREPVAVNARSGQPYLPGIGPHTETLTTALVAAEFPQLEPALPREHVHLEVPYPNAPRSKCDLTLGPAPNFVWGIEVKMLRLLGDNGKPNDNILMHILSPYPAHRSAVTDCEKLLGSGIAQRYAVLIYSYEYPKWPAEPTLRAFEALAEQRVTLGPRHETTVGNLVHPYHRQARVSAWEVFGLTNG